MDGSRKIEVKQSALSSLKSELIRKKEECLLTKAEQTHVPRKKLKSLNKPQKSDETVSQKSFIKDVEETDDTELLIKSRKCLENKARLYDEKLRSAGRSTGEDDSESLVNFQQKNVEESGERTDEIPSDTNSEPDDLCNEYGDDSDWVEYVDFLGRTRKCLKEDLERMKKIDSEFQRTVSKEPNQDIHPPDVLLTDQISERPEFLQKLHEVWEEQEKQLKEKQNIHYQDVFFNEARAHGVGYYAFSTDERARATQQAALERLRQETKTLQQVAKQKATQALTQSAARVDAAKKRMLKLLQAAVGGEQQNGAAAVSEIASSILTPVQAAMEATQKDVLARRTEQLENRENEEETEGAVIGPTYVRTEQEEEKEEEDDLIRRSHIRPWDEGKEGIASKYHNGFVRSAEKEVMSQEKWIEKKREERQQEFSPLQEPDKPGVNLVEESLPAASKNTLFFSSRKKVFSNPTPSHNKLINKFQNSDAAEVGPHAVSYVPPISETGHHPTLNTDPYAGMSPAEISEAVEAGLKYLRQKAEEKQTKPEKGLMGIV
ncbi:coiled-coil domain-containing protein 174 [Schistocerca gregaria]|uniref:coiled-coil domain-containing protein 174 n=1 Tax=Schistocerca gregaria TaxID=7010 RepID=UPI00211F35A2|nr:coiled-coil domain-containing protein 174 [Schistocerca gregaria]